MYSELYQTSICRNFLGKWLTAKTRFLFITDLEIVLNRPLNIGHKLEVYLLFPKFLGQNSDGRLT